MPAEEPNEVFEGGIMTMPIPSQEQEDVEHDHSMGVEASTGPWDEILRQTDFPRVTDVGLDETLFAVGSSPRGRHFPYFLTDPECRNTNDYQSNKPEKVVEHGADSKGGGAMATVTEIKETGAPDGETFSKASYRCDTTWVRCFRHTLQICRRK